MEWVFRFVLIGIYFLMGIGLTVNFLENRDWDTKLQVILNITIWLFWPVWALWHFFRILIGLFEEFKEKPWSK